MNHKQKLGYTLLGAGIMVVGIIIGQFVTPDIKAQSNVVFDKVVCREFEVVDEHGKVAFAFTDNEKGRWIELFDKQGRLAVALVAHSQLRRENGIVVYGRGKMAIDLSATESHRQISISDKNQKAALLFGTNANLEREIVIVDKQEKPAVLLHSGQRLGNGIAIFEKDNKVWWQKKTD